MMSGRKMWSHGLSFGLAGGATRAPNVAPAYAPSWPRVAPGTIACCVNASPTVTQLVHVKRAAWLAMDEMGMEEIGVDRMAMDEMGMDEIGVEARSMDEMGMDEMGELTNPPPMEEMGMDEIGIDEMGIDEIWMDEMGTPASASVNRVKLSAVVLFNPRAVHVLPSDASNAHHAVSESPVVPGRWMDEMGVAARRIDEMGMDEMGVDAKSRAPRLRSWSLRRAA